MSFKFTDFKNGQCYGGQTPDFANGQCDYSGVANNLVADVFGNVTLSHNMAVGGDYQLNSMLNVYYSSEYDSAQTHDSQGLQE